MISLRNRFRIDNITTDTFNQIVKDLISGGWQKTHEYDNFDAWIDYGNLKLTKDKRSLILEWDNWTEGVIMGPKKTILGLKEKYALNEPTPLLI